MQQQSAPHPSPPLPAPPGTPPPGTAERLPGTDERLPPQAQERLPPAEVPRWKTVLWSLVGAVFFAAILVAACVWTLPDLVNDWRVRDTAVPVSNARVTAGRCSSKLFFNICDATLAVPTKSGTVTREVNYVFVDLHSGNYTVDVLSDPQRPDLATTDLGLEKLWNRTITLLIGGGLMLAFLFGGLRAAFRRPAGPA